MINYLNIFKHRAWFALMSVLLMTTLAANSQAAPTASFSANAAGANNNLTLSATVNVADADLGKTGNYYVGFNFQNAWLFMTPQGWVAHSTGPYPVFETSALLGGTAVLLTNADVTAYVGGQLYVGYGLTESDMLNNNKYAHVYTVPANTVPGVTPKGPATVLLGTSANFAILAKTGVSTVPQSAITGNVGVSPAATSFLTGFSLTMVGTTSATSTQVTGSLYGADMTPPTNTTLTTAVLDMQTAYTDAAGRPTPDFLNLGAGNIGSLTLTAGLYKWGTSVVIPGDLVITGGADDVWIFQIDGDMSISANKRITLAGGAQAKNIFWQVAGQVLIEAGARFEGNILSQTAITMQTGASLNGRALAQTMVAVDSATVVKPQ
ncbi:MAG: ice-binding family protein [Pseudohongiella sp.]|nr:ice-binding family protein [Pseudohongiella sp.]MDO9520801.1 ice-binding family protein [Pseudohongiella sp.]MDP2128137.1 ice-binding family protein [Pseudohongiella sp.]